MILRVTCIAVLAIILVAGLWPFHAPLNHVNWVAVHGLRFRKYGSITTAGEFRTPSTADDSCAFEIWLQPARLRGSGTIFSFYQPQAQFPPFALRQSLGDLVFLKADPARPAKKTRTYVYGVFSESKPVLVTINSNQSGTSVYVDGTLLKQLENFHLSNRELTGRLVIGNSSSGTDEWSGQVKGFAIYDRQLSAEQIAQNYRNWKSNTSSQPAENAIAFYTFDEGTGRTIHNHADPATDLQIPERFFVLHQRFLERPWDEYRPGLNYWKDIAINVTGFIPLGFFFYAYFSLLRKTERPALSTTVFGFAVSLTIELLQSLLPTRNSGMTDLFTNTLGTAIGVFLFRISMVQRVLTEIGALPRNSTVSGKAGHSLHEMVPAGAADSSR
jgi:VanZ family protein